MRASGGDGVMQLPYTALSTEIMVNNDSSKFYK